MVQKSSINFSSSVFTLPPSPILFCGCFGVFWLQLRSKAEERGIVRMGLLAEPAGLQKAEWEKTGLVWFCKYQSVLSPTKSKPGMFWSKWSLYWNVVWGMSRNATKPYCSLMNLCYMEQGCLNLFQTVSNHILAGWDSVFLVLEILRDLWGPDLF